jgi:capsular polysaccharide transport system permease protein
LNLRSLYAQERIDPVARLSSKSSKEDFLQYYQKMVSVTKDEISGVMTLKVRAFDPQTAQNIGERILDQTEHFVNRLSDRMQEDSISLAKKELQEAQSDVIASTQALQQYRRQHQNLDPVQTGGGILGMIQELESQLSSARIELKQAREYLREDNPKVTKLKNKISAIETQIERHRQALTGGSGESIVNILQEYERLKLEKELAQEQYKIALSSLESARKEASKKSTYLLRLVEPSLPDEATEPNRLLKVATVLAICLVAYAVLGLLIAAIKEHQL